MLHSKSVFMNFLSKNRYLFLILLGIICILFVYARVMLSPVSSQDEGREVVVAVTGGKLDFGPWEQIFYGEFDGRRRKRVLVKIIGE